MTSPLQTLKPSAHIPRGVFNHADTGHDIGLGYPVAVLRNGSKRYADYPVFLDNLSHQIDVQGGGSVIEYYDPIASVFHFADSTDHSEKPFTVRNV